VCLHMDKAAARVLIAVHHFLVGEAHLQPMSGVVLGVIGAAAAAL
jgi:hypothetical protein